jgi:hypothetical protein
VSPGYGLRAATLILAAATGACSPALNWREVPLQSVVAMLPCKPDQAERTLPLGAAEVTMRMAGCEAGGALYAISHVRITDPTQTEAIHHAWRQAALAAMQANGAAATFKPVTTQAGQAKALLTPEKVDGKRPDGSPLQAQLVWLTRGQDLYHLAVYAPRLQAEMTELLFSELSLR